MVLMFHDVMSAGCPQSGFTKAGAAQYCMDSERFVSLLDEAWHYDADVAMSFDDGGASFYHVIAPELERRGLRGIFFISTAYIGTPGFMSGAEIAGLDRRGHVIASHSHSHPKDISKLPAEEIDREWRLSKEILEGIVGHAVDVASVPGGHVSEQVVASMARAGYATIYTSEPTDRIRQSHGASIHGRYAVTHGTTPQYLRRVLGDKTFRRRLLMRYRLLGAAKKMLGGKYNDIKQLVLKLIR